MVVSVLIGVALCAVATLIVGLLIAAILFQSTDEYEDVADQMAMYRIGYCKSCRREYNAGPVASAQRTDLCYRCSQEESGNA